MSRSDNAQLPIFNEGYHVNVHNDFVLARMDWSIMMHRIMMVLISQIDSRNDDEFHRQYVRIGDLMKATNTQGGSQYRDAKTAVRRLIREPIEVETPDGSYKGISIFTDIEYIRYMGLVSAKFSEKARPYLLQLEKKFTSWRLDQTIPLQTSYSIRHYMIGKMIERANRTNRRALDIGEYRKKLGVEDKYARHVDLKRRVIVPSLEEINKKTDVTIDFETVRKGQTPVAVEFVVEPPDEEPNMVVADAKQPSLEPHEKWYSQLIGTEKYDYVTRKAEEMARRNGWNPDSKAFQAGVQSAIRKLHQIDQDTGLEVDDGELQVGEAEEEQPEKIGESNGGNSKE